MFINAFFSIGRGCVNIYAVEADEKTSFQFYVFCARENELKFWKDQ